MKLINKVVPYIQLDQEFTIRHEILRVMIKKYSNVLLEKKSYAESAMNKEQIVKALPNIAEEKILLQMTVLLANKDIESDTTEKYMVVATNGFKTYYDQYYLRQAEDVLWKRRERLFNFCTKPIVFGVALVSLGVSIFIYADKRKSESSLEVMELKQKALEVKIFRLENSMNNKR